MKEQQLSELIGLIYDCAMDPGSWDHALHAINAAFDGEALILTLGDLENDRALIDRSLGWAPPWRALRDRHLPEVHACISRWLAGSPSLDAPFIASRHLSADYVSQSPYVRDVLVPMELCDVMHLFLMKTQTHVSELVVMHHVRHGPVTEGEIELAKLLLPHLRRAISISRILEAKEVERACFAETLDAMNVGVILTAEDGKILHRNAVARDMLGKAEGLFEAHGTLRADTPAATRDLRDAIRRAGTDGLVASSAGIATALHQSGASPILAHVLPLSASGIRRLPYPGAVAAVFLGAGNDEVQRSLSLTSAFGLTDAESRLLRELLAGKTLAEAAQAQQIALTTAKTHLGNVFAKTGTRRQSELIRLAMQAPGIRPPEPDESRDAEFRGARLSSAAKR